MPDIKSVVSSLVLNIANIIILFVILRALVYKPVKKFMSARAAGISSDIEKAEAKLAEADGLRKKCEAKLAEASDSAEAEKRRILDAAESHAAEITSSAEEEAEKIRESAAVQAQHAADKLRESMRGEIADLSVEIASRIVEREVARSDNQDIIDKYFDRVG